MAGKAPRPSARNWLAVLTVATGTFAVITSELLPVGLLTPIASGLGVSDGAAGFTVTIPGLVAALAAPVVTLLRVDRRLVLASMMALHATGNLLGALTPVFGVMLLARVLIGLAIGGFWAIGAGLGPRLVPGPHAGRATTIIFSGIAVASVLGVPAATAIGSVAGWRMAFVVVAVLNVALLVGMFALPALPAREAVRLSAVPSLLRARGVRVGLVVIVLVVTGHFLAYTYVRPVLQQVSGVAPALISGVLLLYGAAGIVGNFVLGSQGTRRPKAIMTLDFTLLALATLTLPLLRGPMAVGAVLVWGFAYGAVSVLTQTWMSRSATQAPEVGSALFVSAFNLSISLGSLAGSGIVDFVGPTGVLYFGGVLVLLGLVTLVVRGRAQQRVGATQRSAALLG